MFCPNCGVHQTGERRFCTSCGQNLLLISQALGGRFTGPGATRQELTQVEVDRRQDLSKGVKLTIIGGAFLAIQFFSFIFSLPFRGGGSPFGFLTFVALILVAIGVSKLVNARPVTERQTLFQGTATPPLHSVSHAPSREISAHPDAPATGELVEAARHPGASVTEEDTQHLPGYAPPHNQV